MIRSHNHSPFPRLVLQNSRSPRPAMPPPPHKAVTLTHVRYTKGDLFGHFLAWISLVPIFISLGGFVSHFLFRRELQSMFFALGLLISQFINDLVKKSVQQARPETCALLETCDSNGGSGFWWSNFGDFSWMGMVLGG